MSYYEDEQKVNPLKLILKLIVGSLITILFGFIYGFCANGYFFTRILSPFVYAVLIFLVAGLITKSTAAKGLNVITLFCGIWIGVLAVYMGWMYWVYFLTDQMITSPGELSSAVADITEKGYVTGERRGGGGRVEGGSYLYTYWWIWMIFTFGAAVFGATKLEAILDWLND